MTRVCSRILGSTARLVLGKRQEAQMRQIKTILWDVDGTLLDFEASEEACVRLCLKKYGAEIN